jgi:hypothetical protein
VREEVAAKGLPETKEACWAAYSARCRANLHVVLAMSPVGELLRTRCRNFPGGWLGRCSAQGEAQSHRCCWDPALLLRPAAAWSSELLAPVPGAPILSSPLARS